MITRKLSRGMPYFNYNTFIYPQHNILHQLKSQDYIKILMNNGNISYGGNAWWFINNKIFSRDYRLFRYGCGQTAFADLLLYLSLSNDKYNTAHTKMAKNKVGIINQNDYKKYSRAIDNDFSSVYRHIGYWGYLMAKDFNKYAIYYHIDLRAHWGVPNGMTLLECIIEMLDNDIPIIISAASSFVKYFNKKNVKIRLLKCKQEYGINKFYQPLRKVSYKTIPTQFYNHFINITGMIQDDELGVMLIASSWGARYYFCLDEYLGYIKNEPKLLNNILYIRKCC